MKQLLFSVFCCLLFIGSFAQGVPGACGSHPKGWVDPLNGSNTLGMTFNQSACGLNYVAASQLTETRSQAAGFNSNGTGLPTTLGIAGIPSCPTIVKVYVWYTVSYQSSLPASSSVVINSVSVPAVNIGQSGQKCWGELGTVVFRADVTANFTGNGTYNIDITGLGNKNWEVDGVTMIAIYRDNSATYQGSMVLWDGANTCSTGGCSKTQTMTGIAACGASTSAKAFLIVSDMQTASISPPMHNSTLNGATAAYNNDFYNFDVVNTSVTNAQATAAFGTNANNGSDCFCWSLMGLYYQTTNCVTCTPAAISITVTPTQATCGTVGSATVTASGAPLPYTYSWSTGSSSTAITNLSAGTYSIIVTDATGCTATKTFAITMSNGPSATVTPTPAQCFGTTGSAITNTTGGTTPYTYAWSSTPPQSTPNATGLPAGTYSITVTDATGCSVPLTVTITQPPAITVSVTPVNPTCGGSNGSASVISGGGTGAHTYLWSTSATGNSISNLAPGSYSIAVTDASGCTSVQTFNISASGTLSVTPTSKPVLCFGASTGTAAAATTGGAPPYTYAWTPPVTVTANASNLPAGTYSCLVTDATGCSFTATYTITQPATALTTSTSVVNNVSCFGGNNGSAATSPTGGTGAYTYVWTPSAQNTATATGLIPGNYSALVTDANGCTASQGVTITQPSIISLPSSATTASCGLADGSATVNPTGGVGPYTYLWLTSPVIQSTPTATNLLSGTYSIIVTDANGCFQSQSVVVPGLVPPVADFYYSPDAITLMDPLVTFTDASGGVITGWQWVFGDPISGANDSSSLQNPNHLYSDTGSYCITLSVMNTTAACADTVTKCLRVEPNTTFYVPNTFTPNHDGKNEIFYAYGTYIGEFHMYVFDRWGNLIFESNDLYKGWDGSVRNKGDIVQEDVYVWKVKYFDMTGAEYNQIGHVTIVK